MSLVLTTSPWADWWLRNDPPVCDIRAGTGGPPGVAGSLDGVTVGGVGGAHCGSASGLGGSLGGSVDAIGVPPGRRGSTLSVLGGLLGVLGSCTGVPPGLLAGRSGRPCGFTVACRLGRLEGRIGLLGSSALGEGLALGGIRFGLRLGVGGFDLCDGLLVHSVAYGDGVGVAGIGVGA